MGNFENVAGGFVGGVARGAIDSDEIVALMADGPCGEVAQHTTVDVSSAIDDYRVEYDGYGARCDYAFGHWTFGECHFCSGVDVGGAHQGFYGQVFNVFIRECAFDYFAEAFEREK